MTHGFEALTAGRSRRHGCPGYSQHRRPFPRFPPWPIRSDGPWVDAITRHTASVQAARHIGDRIGQANALNDLGAVRRQTGDYQAAAQAQEQALEVFQRIGAAEAADLLAELDALTGP